VASDSGSATFEVAVSFAYLGNSITGISHSTLDGCLPEFLLSLSDLSAAVVELQTTGAYWQVPANSYAALAALSVASLISGETRKVRQDTNIYELWTWDSTSLAVTDGTSVIRPTSIGSDVSPGRWLKVSGSSGGFSGSGFSGEKSTLSADRVLTSADPYALVLEPDAPGHEVTLYNGTTSFRQHLIINSSSSQSMAVLDELSASLATLAPGEQLSVIWDTTLWRII
jgi:hypothetical protein